MTPPESDTPRTNANYVRGFEALGITKDEDRWVRAEFAEKLEREAHQARMDAAADAKRLIDDKMKLWDRVIELERELAARKGYVLVPVEPSEAMALAGRKACMVVADRMETAKLTAVSVVDFWQQVGHQPANSIYAAMLAAAPSATNEE